VFQRVADSASAQASSLAAQTSAAIGDVARALVTNRASGLLVLGDPAGAKVVVVRDSLGEGTVLAAVTGTGDVSSARAVRPSLEMASGGQQFDSLVSTAGPAVTRVLFAPATSPAASRTVAEGAQRLSGVDATVAVARFRLAEEIEAQKLEIELLARLAATLSADSAEIGALAVRQRVLGDSIARLDQMMAAAEARLRGLMGQETAATRSLAAENQRTADSLRAALAAGVGPEDRAAIDAEVATAAAYARIADMLTTGLDKAIAQHPAFVARDSVRAHNARALTTLNEVEGTYTGSRRAVDDALAELRNGDGPSARAARQALADAEARRSVVEGEVIAAVSAELSGRASALVAGLQHSAEAAQFGMASAAFFRAIDATRAVGGIGPVGGDRRVAPDQRR
jgi:hypothetical protein